MKTKTNNLEDFDKKFVDSFAGVPCVCRVNKDNVEFYKPEEIKSYILNREKALLNKPLGVSQWKAHGKKYGYDKYFEKALLKELADKVEEIRMSTNPPNRPTRFRGLSTRRIFNEAIDEILKILKPKN